MNVLKPFLQRVRQIFYIILYKIFCLFNKLNDDRVLFLSASRASLTGNFKFVYDEIKKKNKYDINLMLKSSLKVRYTFSQSIRLMYLISTSKYIYLDDFYPIIYALKLRKGTNLIQLWHAMGAFKRVGYSRLDKDGGPAKNSLTHKNYTGAIVSSENIRKDYAEAFGISIDKVHALGIPRTDIFFDKKYADKVKNTYYKKYPVLKDKKVILFAPTFRGAGQKAAHYNFDWFDFKRFSDTFSDEYVCIIKLHPFIKNRPVYKIEKDSFYIDMTSEREINDILFITDILITDYSSVIFEYSFFKKPVIFYTPDLDEYKKSRDFYYPLSKYTYGPVVKNFNSLLKEIKTAKVDLRKLDSFYNYFCSSCDGKSTKRVVKYFMDNK